MLFRKTHKTPQNDPMKLSVEIDKDARNDVDTAVMKIWQKI